MPRLSQRWQTLLRSINPLRERSAHLLLRMQREKDALLHLATSSALNDGSIELALREICRVAAEVLEVERVGVWLFEADQKELRCLNSFNCTSGQHSGGEALRTEEFPQYIAAILENRVVAIDDTKHSPLCKDFPYVQSLGIASMVDAPFHIGGKLAGIVCHEHTGKPRHWDFHEQDFAASIGDMLSRAFQAAERARIEQELERKSTAIEASVDGIAILDNHEKYIYVNRAHALLYGYGRPEDLIGKSWRELYDSEELQRFESELMPEFRRQGKIRLEAQGKRRDGTRFEQEISLAALRDGGLICICQDITERKRLHSELLQSQKMEAIGQLAGGIAHDFNNILSGILGYASLLKLECAGNQRVFESADLIEAASEKAALLTQKLLGFARQGKHQNIAVDLHEAINDVLTLLQRTIEKNITIVCRLDALHSIVNGDPIQLQQVLINLAINARDAMSLDNGGSDGGTLLIQTRSRALCADADLQLCAGEYLELLVQDSGCGIPPEIIERVFEPFFTTKRPGKGSGLGLSMVYGIVRNHGGTINVRSDAAEGTSFRILLPLAPQLSTRLEKFSYARTQEVVRYGGGTILLVDDHAIMRESAARMLHSLGYRVITAKDGIEALNYYSENSADIDLVILDMIMPRMGARDCFRAMRKINPHAKALLASGYANNHLVQEILDEGVLAFIPKPASLAKLSQVVADALAATTVRSARLSAAAATDSLS
ncbi:MAG: response regulator [Oligoflexia bacterium]|nr:response regulator [Oligoflexia bacterium]